MVVGVSSGSLSKLSVRAVPSSSSAVNMSKPSERSPDEVEARQEEA
jgi:hypothetical protein